MDQLKQLGELHEHGVLSDEEFERGKGEAAGFRLSDTGDRSHPFGVRW